MGDPVPLLVDIGGGIGVDLLVVGPQNDRPIPTPPTPLACIGRLVCLGRGAWLILRRTIRLRHRDRIDEQGECARKAKSDRSLHG
jgi:hypothetical protein